MLKGNPTILLVDDEELLREVATMMIEEEGGNVILANDGQEGVDIFTQNKDSIDCVVLDFSMPRLNGYQAYLAINKLPPKTPILMVSGLSVTPEVAELRKQGKIEFLSKPFLQKDLIALIAKLTAAQG